MSTPGDEHKDQLRQQLRIQQRKLKKIVEQFADIHKTYVDLNLQVRRIEASTTLIHDSLKNLHDLLRGNGNRKGFETMIALLEERVENIDRKGQGTNAWVLMFASAVISGAITVFTVLLMRGIK